jgi:hypothetical protein
VLALAAEAPQSEHIMLASAAHWVEPDVRRGGESFEAYPDMPLAQWHEQRGLVPSPR